MAVAAVATNSAASTARIVPNPWLVSHRARTTAELPRPSALSRMNTSAVSGSALMTATLAVSSPAAYTMGDRASAPPSARCSTWRRWPRNHTKASTAMTPNI